MPTARNVGRSSSHVRRQASHTRHPVSDRVPPATARRFTRPSLPCPAASDGWEAVIPRPVVWGLVAVVLPRSCSPVPLPGRFGRATADYVDRLQAALGSRHRPGTAPGPAGDPVTGFPVPV